MRIGWSHVGVLVLGWGLAALAFSTPGKPGLKCGPERDAAMVLKGAELFSCAMKRSRSMPAEEAVDSCTTEVIDGHPTKGETL